MRLLGGTPGYRSADRVLPEFQDLRPGDFISSAPPDLLGGRLVDVAGWTVTHVDPGHALVLSGWGAFVLEPIGPRRTRLIVRTRGDAPSFIGGRVAAILFWDPAHFIMERKMLLGIKARAEASANRDS